jgi:hypothetical protein
LDVAVIDAKLAISVIAKSKNVAQMSQKTSKVKPT